MVNVLKLAMFNAVALPVTLLLSFAAAAVSGWAGALLGLEGWPMGLFLAFSVPVLFYMNGSIICGPDKKVD